MLIPLSLLNDNVNDSLINKEIVCDDVILTMDRMDTNIKITSISDVEEYWLELCLTKILKSNPDVMFDNIQYSKKRKTVYFYTNKEISVDSWLNRNVFSYNQLTDTTSILTEVKRLLLLENTFDCNCVSLTDIISLLKRNKKNINNRKKYYKKRLEGVCKFLYPKFSNLVIYDLDYDNEEMIIEMCFSDKKYGGGNFVVSKNDKGVFLKEDFTKDGKGKDFYLSCFPEINKCYVDFLQHKKYTEKSVIDLKSLNSNFVININSFEVSIHNRGLDDKSKFMLSWRLDTNKFLYGCNSDWFFDVLENNEDKIFKNIFVNISDCPEWMHDELYDLRRKQMEDEQKKYEKRKREEKDREEKERRKRRSLLRKIGLFFK